MKSILIAKIHATIECSVCQEIMHVPFMMQCGHSSCYKCLYTWFGVKMNCPTCREINENKPILNVPLRQISRNISDLIIEMSKDKDEADRIKSQREEAIEEYQEDFEQNALFGDAFKSALTLIDRSDGVPRCGNCHWEAHGTVCLHCGTRFRIPREDSYYDSDDGDAYDEDDEETTRYGGNGREEYDSEDSFIDNGIPSIDLRGGDSSDDDVREIYGDEWTGFDNQSIGSSMNDDYEADLHRALEDFHNDALDDDSDDTDDIIHRRPRVIDISDDDE